MFRRKNSLSATYKMYGTNLYLNNLVRTFSNRCKYNCWMLLVLFLCLELENNLDITFRIYNIDLYSNQLIHIFGKVLLDILSFLYDQYFRCVINNCRNYKP